MSDYKFKQWLTFEEAAAFLTDQSDEDYTPEQVRRAVCQRLISAHYWPADGARLGVFTEMRRTGDGETVCNLAESEVFLANYAGPASYIYDDPVPLFNPGLFLKNATLNLSVPIGVTVWNGREIKGGCYRIGPDGEAVSMASGRYEVLIHLVNLQEFLEQLPNLQKQPPQETWLGFASDPHKNSTFGVAHCGILGLSQADSDQPAQYGADFADSGADMPALKALSFAAHLIADLAERLDEAESTPSRKLGLKLAGKPNVSKIAAQLASTAAGLNYTGHGYGAKGFQANLSTALRSIDAPE